MKEAWTHTAQMWYDETENLLTIRIANNVKLDIKDIKSHFEVAKRLVGNNKPLVLSDIRATFTMTAEARKYSASQSNTRKAIAIVTNKIVTRMFFNFFFLFNKHTAPTKLFNSEQAALIWLKKMH